MKSLSLPKIQNYCTPAKAYLFLTVITIAFTLVSNIGSTHTFNLGYIKAYVGNTYLAILLEIIWLFVFAWFIDWLCRNGSTNIAWFIFLFPFLLILAVTLGLSKISLPF
tara:strand:+ start:245 stop:571 length:327 start_codon:yes stop_codon:yes gene_type:complete